MDDNYLVDIDVARLTHDEIMRMVEGFQFMDDLSPMAWLADEAMYTRETINNHKEQAAMRNG